MSRQIMQLSPDIEARIDDLLRHQKGVEPGDLVDVVESIMTSAQGDLSAANLKLYAEIEALAEYIQAARSEIASLRPDEITAHHLPVAGEELEAIVGATEHATNSIMEAAEAIENTCERLPDADAAEIGDAVTRIYEACSFQDITGQRISKVVNALRHIEDKVHALLEALGQEALGVTDESVEKRKRADGNDRPDEHLLNGPQSADEAISQDDIDKLLASFD